MGLFKKKEAAKIVQNDTASIEIGKDATPIEVPKELSPEAKVLMAKLETYKKEYHGIYRKEDFGILDRDAEICNLLFATYCEIRELRKAIEKATQDE